ncbi:GNAT family N-acetyltransferase [Acinetobacter bohemicus]|uniref:GNAT family N-acetyltransferase n=1 Tax=Acinetobacter lwoffii TaxID=28090 RepID=A0A9D2USI9_ACILW|nr:MULTISPECIES: GNAT family N-acetyltransferase [Acinetobacter]MDM1782540.1 GNAT family N-acetyltransferase [Acinetobacter indicus]HJF27926.1 GNAT family N-acetyltransferase [Acinetobacter lwoffii]MCO8042112.1 GNAT family N-acetyltransferase [Acinetobacter sp. S4400-12]MCU7224206.1 GNAT family N-acetyltransferase [Acinetobacter bohemicus]QKQ70280.1 GNAT family N-acetyltransferase [Acinetobacter sp. 10FS3-1]
MIVRRAQSEDLHNLAVLFDEYRQFYGASSNFDLSHQFLKQRFEDGQTVIFINTKDEALIGFIVLYLGFSSVACSTYYILDDVYISPAYRRQGAAKQLIDTAVLFAKHQQALRISLETQKNNYQSHHLYESMGFVKDDEFQTYHCFLK